MHAYFFKEFDTMFISFMTIINKMSVIYKCARELF